MASSQTSNSTSPNHHDEKVPIDTLGEDGDANAVDGDSQSSEGETVAVVELEIEDDAPDRGAWGGELEFLLTMVGYAVGLGNVWRFPYLAYKNGGGAFLIPFIVCLITVGFPVFLAETSLGQFCSLGPTQAWKFAPLFKGIGLSMVIVATYMVLYYNVIVAWCLYFFFASMTNVLPWVFCDNWWNTPGCMDETTNATQIINGTLNNYTVKSAAEEYFYNGVLRMSDGIENMGGVVWQLALVLLLAWTIIFLVLLKGVATLGKVSYFVSLFPYVLLTIMLIQGALLDGATDGMIYLFKPVWSKLYDPVVWSNAVSQVFYSCGCCFGGLLAMASFNKFNYNVRRDAVLVPCVVLFTSLYASLVVFSVLGYISKQTGLPIESVALDGPGLVFVVYPYGLATMPVAPLWAILFFFMMSTLGFSSQFSMSEAVCTAAMDEFPGVLRKGNRPFYVRLVFCTACFLLALPQVTPGGFYLFTIMDEYTSSYPLFIIGISELLALNWVYGFKNFGDDIKMMLGSKPNYFWKAMWLVISPLMLLLVIILTAIYQEPLTLGDYVYPGWANAIAWLVVAFPLTSYLAWVIGYWLQIKSWQVFKPLPTWGPASSKNRLGRYARPRPTEGGANSVTEPDDKQAEANATAETEASLPPSYTNLAFVDDNQQHEHYDTSMTQL